MKIGPSYLVMHFVALRICPFYQIHKGSKSSQEVLTCIPNPYQVKCFPLPWPYRHFSVLLRPLSTASMATSLNAFNQSRGQREESEESEAKALLSQASGLRFPKIRGTLLLTVLMSIQKLPFSFRVYYCSFQPRYSKRLQQFKSSEQP